MPGIVDTSTDYSGSNREIGKMASFLDGALELEMSEILSVLKEDSLPDLDLDNIDPLPDEDTVDIIKYLENNSELDSSFVSNCAQPLKCVGDCTKEKERTFKQTLTTKKDPFLHSTLPDGEAEAECRPHFGAQKYTFKEPFVAWGHRIVPVEEESCVSMSDDEYTESPKVSFKAIGSKVKPPCLGVTRFNSVEEVYAEDEKYSPCDTKYLASLSSPDVVTGSDSDVDIETIDTPRRADSCGYQTQDSLSPVYSPNPESPEAQKSFPLSNSPASTLPQSGSMSSKSLLQLSTYGVSSSASLAENLMFGRSSHGTKRKRVKKMAAKSDSNTVVITQDKERVAHFHNYAMNPASCSTPLETGQPTVIAKRLYKRKQSALDVPDKEKQHHHNQLERNRRQKLADLFTDLRDQVPKIAHHLKASKVMILNEAGRYIHELRRIEKNQNSEIERCIEKRESLEAQLEQLQANRTN